MRAKLDDGKIKYIIREKEKGTPNSTIAENMKVSARHVRRLWARYRNTRLAANNRQGRPARHQDDIDEESGWCWPSAGAVVGGGRITKALSDKNISGRTVYDIMKEHGLVEPCPAKTRKQVGAV